MIFDKSESLVFPRKYLRFLKKHATLGGPGPQKCVFGRNEALLRFPGPKTALWGPECDPGAPCSNPFIKQTFWGVFWRPRGGKTGFGAKMGGKGAQNENFGEKAVWAEKWRRKAKCLSDAFCLRSHMFKSQRTVQDATFKWTVFDRGRTFDGNISNMAAVVCKVVGQWGMSGETCFA